MILSGARFDVFNSEKLFSLVRNWDNREEIFLLHSNGWSFLGFGEEVLNAFPGKVKKMPIISSVDLEFAHIPFVGGYMLALAYDEIPSRASEHEFSFFADRVIAINHAQGETFLLGLGNSKKEGDEKVGWLRKTAEEKENDDKSSKNGAYCAYEKMKSNMTREEYKKSLGKIKHALQKGETYQVNFAQKFEAPFFGDPFLIFERVNSINPSDFQCFLETKNFALISNSPERLISARKSGAQTILQSWPIKGTVPRGKNEKEDAENIAELLKSKKDEAELAMIVDLVRNDLGKVSKIGSVHIKEHRRIEKYSHVIHTTTIVESVLREGCNLIDALLALFPGGSITGCPKKRTMEIIKKLEPCKRGFYTGSAGYISVNGNMDFNILIRSMVFLPQGSGGGGMLEFYSGGGIVIDSDADMEYEETLHKAKALAQSLVGDIVQKL